MQKEAKFLTIAQAAQFLNVSPDTLRRWEDKGIVTPLRTEGGSRRYTLLDLKIAKLNKRKVKFSQISTLFRKNYINSKRDLKIALVTSFLWVVALLTYHFLPPVFLKPANPEQRILSDQLKESTRLKIASETTPREASFLLRKKISAIKTLVISGPTESETHSRWQTPVTPQTISPTRPDLLTGTFNGLPTLKYTETPDPYYSLKPLPQN